MNLWNLLQKNFSGGCGTNDSSKWSISEVILADTRLENRNIKVSTSKKPRPQVIGTGF